MDPRGLTTNEFQNNNNSQSNSDPANVEPTGFWGKVGQLAKGAYNEWANSWNEAAKSPFSIERDSLTGALSVQHSPEQFSEMPFDPIGGRAKLVTKLGTRALKAPIITKAFDKVKNAASKLISIFLPASKEVSVIGPRSTYREFDKKIGANFLNVTDDAWSMRKNVKFLQGVVKRGDDVVFSGKYNPKLLDPNSVLAQEIRYLKRHGYLWNKDLTKLIKK